MSKQALAIATKTLGADHPDTLGWKESLALRYEELGQFEKAIPVLEQVLAYSKKVYGESHRYMVIATFNLGECYCLAGRSIEAIPLLEAAWPKAREYADADFFRGVLLTAYTKGGETAKGIALALDNIQHARKVRPAGSPELAGQLAISGFALLELKDWVDAETVFRECLTIREKVQPDAWNTFNTMSLLGASLLGQKKHAEAESLLLAGYEGMKQREEKIPKTGEAAQRIPQSIDRLIELYTATNKPDEVKKWQAERAKYPEAKKQPEKK